MVTDALVTVENEQAPKAEPHRYGGWYCPDNLNGFPAVDLAKWNEVPVVHDRMPTLEETQNGTSLIFVDAEKYPNAKPLGIAMPKLAHFYNHSAKRSDLVIVIQAVNIDNDSIVGFRYLNGGNGSARLNEVVFLNENELAELPSSRFITQVYEINATPAAVWEILTKPEHSKDLQATFDPKSTLNRDWRNATNLNFHYANAGKVTAQYADKLFGNFYIQNDYEQLAYTEKFILLQDETSGITTLQFVCGPYLEDFEAQQKALMNWAKAVKKMSEAKAK